MSFKGSGERIHRNLRTHRSPWRGAGGMGYVPLVGRPVIGITTYAQEATWGVWKMPAALIPLDYVDAVERAGGRALLVPPCGSDVEDTLDALDGIVFSGGADVDPAMYGKDAHPETDSPQVRRDTFEMALLTAALERDIPTLAICRGFQLLNVARGGDLVQHLPETVGHEDHREVQGEFSEHDVEVKEGSKLASIVGTAPAAVSSHHHQGVGRVGDGLVETAWARDGTLEGVEDPSRRFAVGVQWHPEMGKDGALFRRLVAEAREYRSARGIE
jgi:putative glutamine amidotransferase